MTVANTLGYYDTEIILGLKIMAQAIFLIIDNFYDNHFFPIR
jgi:hypothetical protein